MRKAQIQINSYQDYILIFLAIYKHIFFLIRAEKQN